MPSGSASFGIFLVVFVALVSGSVSLGQPYSSSSSSMPASSSATARFPMVVLSLFLAPGQKDDTGETRSIVSVATADSSGNLRKCRMSSCSARTSAA